MTSNPPTSTDQRVQNRTRQPRQSSESPDDILFNQSKEPATSHNSLMQQSNQHRAPGPKSFSVITSTFRAPREPNEDLNLINRVPAPRSSRSTSRRNRPDNRPYADHTTRLNADHSTHTRIMFDHRQESLVWNYQSIDQRSFPS